MLRRAVALEPERVDGRVAGGARADVGPDGLQDDGRLQVERLRRGQRRGHHQRHGVMTYV